jgi:hypothetical protein
MWDVHRKCQGGKWLGNAVPVKIAEVQDMARHAYASKDHTTAVTVRAAPKMPHNSGEATK